MSLGGLVRLSKSSCCLTIRRLWIALVIAAVVSTATVGLPGVAGAGSATVAAREAVPAAASTGGYPWASATCQTTPLTYNGVQYCPNDNWVYNGGLFDTWGYNYSNCTSWVAWRLSTNNGYTMPHAIGDASAWGSYFATHGHAPNNKPAPGAIAWESGGDHVAYVESVSANGSKVTISEYNEGFYPGQPTTGDGLYDTRTVPTGNFEYIHVKDITRQLLWKLRNTNSSGAANTAFYYGASTDTPVVGDWNGNRTATAGIVRPDGSQLLWKLRNTNSPGPADGAFDYGASNALPTPGNWDGVGSTTPGVVRTDDGSGQLLWELRNADGPGPATYEFHYGPSNALPVVGDWDGNGTVTIGVVRQDPSTGTLLWELRNSNSSGPADVEFHYGPDGALPVVGDWDGNGTATVGVVRPVNGQLYWELRNSASAGAPDLNFYYGAPTDIPVVGDWNGNGTVTVGIVRR